MNVHPVDERTASWKNIFPDYRVIFFERGPGGWITCAYDVHQAHSVHHVIAWADANAQGRTYCLYVIIEGLEVSELDANSVGLLQLSGWEPVSPTSGRQTPPPDFPREPTKVSLPPQSAD